MHRETAVIVTLLVYKICLVFIGLICRTRTRDGLDFYLGGRKLGPMVAAISASASSSSAWTLLGVSGAAYAWGVSAIWLFPSCVGGFLLNWFILAPALQKLAVREKAVTVTDILAGLPGTRYRRAITVLSSIIILASLGTYIASQLQGAGKTFSTTFEISLSSSILIGSGIVVFYTMLGGFWAVSVTDTLQGLLMAATSVVLPFAAVLAVGGPASFFSEVTKISDPNFLSITQNLPTVSSVGFVLGLLGIGLGYPGQPHVVNRFMALSEGPKHLVRARTIAILWAVVVYSGMIILGLAGRILLPSLGDPEVVFITLTNDLFPPVVSGIMLAAVLSAIMSTADSQLLVASSSISHDLRLGEKTGLSQITRSRIVVLVVSFGAVVGALLGSQEIFSQVLFAWAAMGSAFGPVLLITSLKGPVEGRAKLASILAGFTLSVGAFYFFPATLQWKGALERVLPFLIALILAYYGFVRESARLEQEAGFKPTENWKSGRPK